MAYIGELVSIGVAVSWTVTAILSEYAGKRMGSITLNLFRMIFALGFSVVFFLYVFGEPLPIATNTKAIGWMLLSGVIGYVICDYCLMKCYIIIGSLFGQLFMTLAPLSAALTAWITLGQELRPQSLLAMAITLTGIAISIFGRNEHKRITLKLPIDGVFYAVIAALCQGIGLVVSKIGMNYYEETFPAWMNADSPWLLPFCANFFRCIAGFIGFFLLASLTKGGLRYFYQTTHDHRGLLAVVCTTVFGPFAGVAFSLLAVQYTEAGIASTLMALTPIFILLPAKYIFHQSISWKAVLGAFISVVGVSLFFLL